jgi:hypothetical protein
MKNKVQLGTISHATMQPRDLIPRFYDELRFISPRKAGKLHVEYRNTFRLAHRLGWEVICDQKPDDADLLLESLFDTLDECAPEFCYFGAHEGEGADYGFWPYIEAAEEDSLKVSDLSEIPNGYTGFILHVNDHGNVTLYRKPRNHRLIEIWSLV